MSQGIHFVSSNIPGYRPAEGKCLLCSGGSGVVTVSSYSSSRLPGVKNLLAKSSVLVSKRTSSFVANFSNNRRNPDFSKQNKQQSTWFPRNKNRQNHNRDNFENHEDSELLSSENGAAFPVSSSPMYKATATPGPKEKEIVELFRKVQAELRERAAKKEENNTEASEGQGKENETVESLLSILRKHSGEQGNRKSSSSNNISNSLDSVMEQRDQTAPFDEEEIPDLSNSNNGTRLEAQRTSHKPFRRPVSNFRRKSPVPRVKFQPVYTAEDDIGSNSSLNSQGRRMTEVKPDPEPELKPYPELDDELDSESDSDSDTEAEEILKPEAISVSANVHDEVFAETSVSEISDIDEAYHDAAVETESSTKQADLSELKLSDLKELAKSRGLKGYSKLKKADLVELLSG